MILFAAKTIVEAIHVLRFSVTFPLDAQNYHAVTEQFPVFMCPHATTLSSFATSWV